MMHGARKRVEQQLRGKKPSDVAWFFYDRALILMKEAKVDPKLLHERIDAVMKDDKAMLK